MTKRLILVWLALLSLWVGECRAQFTWVTNSGAITITGYDGFGGEVFVPSQISGLPVTRIGDAAFIYRTNLTSVTVSSGVVEIGALAFYGCAALTNINLPDSVTTIDDGALSWCTGLIQIAIPPNVTTIGDSAFDDCSSLVSLALPNGLNRIGSHLFSFCSSLTNVTIPSRVTSIGDFAFAVCSSLTKVTIPQSVTNLGTYSFGWCSHLESIRFLGNAPSVAPFALYDNVPQFSTVLFLPGTSGWGASFGGRPTAQLFLPAPLILAHSFGLETPSSEFGFTISWATNVPVVIEACTNFYLPTWQTVKTIDLTNGSARFSDPLWKSYTSRFYRLRAQ